MQKEDNTGICWRGLQGLEAEPIAEASSELQGVTSGHVCNNGC